MRVQYVLLSAAAVTNHGASAETKNEPNGTGFSHDGLQFNLPFRSEYFNDEKFPLSSKIPSLLEDIPDDDYGLRSLPDDIDEDEYPLVPPHMDCDIPDDVFDSMFPTLEQDPFDQDGRELSVESIFDTANENSRRLSANSATIGTFDPLPCNSNLNKAPCTVKVSQNMPTGNNPLLIRCGECFIFDLNTPEVNFPGGMNIEGKLKFPDNKKVKIRTKYVIVQGELEITTSHTTVSPANEMVVFNITGTDDVTFGFSKSPHNPCAKQPNGQCNLGSKPFVVAGGKMNIKAFPSNCETHTTILKKIFKRPSKQANDFPKYQELPPACPVSGTNYVRYNFNDGSVGNWTGNYGAFVRISGSGKALKVTNRKTPDQGPLLDISSLRPHLCLEPQKDYIFSVKIKLTRADGGNATQPTYCKTGSPDNDAWWWNCPRLTSRTSSPGKHRHRTLKHMNPRDAPNYGEWTDFTGVIRFEDYELWDNVTYFVLQIDRPEAGTDMTIDNFRIGLPSESSFMNPNDVCGNLVMNSDASGNGMSPYPMKKTGWDSSLLVLKEEGKNRFYRLTNRRNKYYSIHIDLPTKCLDTGVVYKMRTMIRVHTEFDEKYYFYVRAKDANGDWFHRTILECDAHNFSDGWTKCMGRFTIDERMAGSTEASVRMDFYGDRDKNFDVDFDDITIKFHEGFVEKLVVSKPEAQCWGERAEIHVGSSVYYSWRKELSNGFTSEISQVTDLNDGRMEFKLTDPPFIPIVSSEESADMAADVALVSRNVKIAGDEDEENKGAYVQLLHTPNIVQIISGVEFLNMGRRGEVDKFALQILYSGPLVGTEIAFNSFFGSNQRCIVIEGSGNMTISNNVGVSNYGNCIFSGYSAGNNTIKKNFVSDAKSIKWDEDIPGSNDHNPSGFYNLNGPNDYIGNVAVGNRYYGFYFVNDWRVRHENGTTVSGVPSPRSIPMGIFKRNTAKSNGQGGMHFYAHQQIQEIVFEKLKSLKNRYHGLYFGYGQRAKIEKSTFVGNGYGVETRYSDEVKIIDTDFFGRPKEIKMLVKPPYFNKPCITDYFYSPIGYRMQTAIYRFDQKLSDGTYLDNKGAKLRNVRFFDFDFDDECSDSVPVAFNTKGKQDGHWNYVSSFRDVQFNGVKMIDATSADEEGVPDVVITDINGSSDPSGQASKTASIVSSKPHLIAFAGGECKDFSSGMKYCMDTCLRTVTLLIDQTDSEKYDLKITRHEDEVETYGKSFYQFDDDSHRLSFEGNERAFSASLPLGTYKFEFFDGLTPVWPTHVYEIWEGKPACTDHANGIDVTVVQPEITRNAACNSLVVNSDMSMGTKYWHHRNGHSDTKRGYIKALEGAGRGGTMAIGNFNRTSNHQGIGQNLDTRCFHQNLDGFYEINVWFRLENSTVTHICDNFKGDWLVRCPTVTFKYARYEDPLSKENLKFHYGQKARTVMPNDSNGFNLMHGVVKIDNNLHDAQRAFMYTDYAHSSLDVIIDDFTITKLEPACSGEWIRNGDFELGYSSFFTNYGTVKYNVKSIQGDHVIEVYDKSRNSHGLLQYLYVDQSCVKEKDRFRVVAKFQLKNPQGAPIQCNRTANDALDMCGNMAIYTTSPVKNRYAHVASAVAIAPGEDDGWGIMAGIYTLTASELNHTSMYLRLVDTHKNSTVIYDDVSITSIPVFCSQMVVNPSFEGGTSSFWMPYNKLIDYVVTEDGASNSEYAIRYQRGAGRNYYYLYQELDTRCFVQGQKFDVTARFKILNATVPSEALSCDPAERNLGRDDVCPVIYMRGYNCEGDDVDAHLFNENQSPWIADSYNEFIYDFTVSANLATCQNVRLGIGRYTPAGRALLIDEVQFGQKTTFAPTPNPTFSPTKKRTTGPTASPIVRTDAPTTSASRSCPPVGTHDYLIQGSIVLGRGSNNVLCTITKVLFDTDGITVVNVSPLARSYEQNDWEISAGEVARSTFRNDILCYSKGCQINLPPLGPKEKYRLSSFRRNLSKRDELARFLETATFGVTKTELDNLYASGSNTFQTIKNWFRSQIDLGSTKLTSHRKFWRERANPRAPAASNAGIPDHPCDRYSRWRRFTFVKNDVLWWMSRELRVEGSAPYTLYLDGIFRTVVDNFWLAKNDTYVFDPNFAYVVCRTPEERVDGTLYIELQDGECVRAENPKVDLNGNLGKAKYIINIPLSNLATIDVEFSNGEEFILQSALNDAICNDIPTVPEIGDEIVFARVSDGSWLQFDPRFSFETNTKNNPLGDGGKAIKLAGGSYCSNVPRTFLNEDSCKSSTNACQTTSKSNDAEVLLNNRTLTELNHLTQRYLYVLEGLNVVDLSDKSQFPWKLEHPCTPGLRTRWILRDFESCQPTELYTGTNATLIHLLSSSRDRNPYMRDIFFPERGSFCNATDTNPEIEIRVKDKCWKRVHHDFWSIYDMTYWVEKHPGGANPIIRASENNGTTLVFPNGHATNGHTMDRWINNYQKFTYIGRLGDYLRIRDLPNELRTENVTSYYDNDPKGNGYRVLVCGSPAEVSNRKPNGFFFDVSNGFQTGSYSFSQNRMNVWNMISLSANDQLRQRVAWALSQILVVVTSAIGDASWNTEWFLAYYDIFVRNGFGNYRDILKEISYSPLMAENLSFLGSKSSAYVWERYRVKAQADENFAREIMQLFSMGILKLNMDGSPQLDVQGNTMLAYTNDDIMSLSRAWTGFDLQPRRSNIEGRDNRLDPMQIQAIWRDRSPKTDSTGGYIGDGYPLCEDLPNRAYLKEGAAYRFLGSSPLPELMSDPAEFATDESIQRVVLSQSSALRAKLCGAGQNGGCLYKNTVVLDASINCSGVECDLDTVRVVQVAESAFYEYVQLPCVDQAFYNKGVKISPRYRGNNVMCGNPKVAVAAEACCDQLNSYTAVRNSQYDGQRMTLEAATARCSELDNREICDFTRVNGDRHKNSMYFWTSDDCYLRAKINDEGMVTVVHHPTDFESVVSHVDDQNENFFRVYWKNGRHLTASNGCDGVCEVVDGNSCLCGTQVVTRAVFSQPPSSIAEALEKLYIGAPDPNVFARKSFSPSFDASSGIKTYMKNGQLNENAVFEFTDDKGRNYFLKNSQETVQVRGINGGNTMYSFRNAPQFMSFVPSETTKRDAQHETEATLDHYFYHDNTAPFLASRLIQRLISSNPSPRYILAVATAFKTGHYESSGEDLFGTGQYGDLAATFAAIYLDREARETILDADPSQGALREPLLKLLSVMRSMEFTSTIPVTRLNNVKRQIGQEPHSFGTVFSFFLPEFKPYGRVGDASLVSPEATLLDMPKIIGLLNGFQSLVNYGLSSCNGGFGWSSCRERMYAQSPYGFLQFGKIDESSQFQYDTFEGPSLSGGFDTQWVGRQYNSHRQFGEVVQDPLNSNNHVFHPKYDRWYSRFYSAPASKSSNTVVKFQYHSTQQQAGGCIGYIDTATDNNRLTSQTWIYCDARAGYAENIMIPSTNSYISCQFEIPNTVNQFRIIVGDRVEDGDAYFDNISISQGSGTTCTGVSVGNLTPTGQTGHSSRVVDELATLLTAGRLSSENKNLLRGAYDRAGSANDGLRTAQELILTSAEFHTTNFVESENRERDDVSFPQPTNKPYRAIIYIMLSGGCDSYNMLVPHTCETGKDLYTEYLEVRQQVAISKQNLLPIDAKNQVCEKFGIHPDLETLHSLYQDKDLLFFANTGVLSKPVNKKNYNILTQTQLFAHNHMQRESKRLDPYDLNAGTGVLGRLGDVLAQRGHNVGSFSVDRYSVALVGQPGISEAPMIVNRNGVPSVHLHDPDDLLKSLHKTTSIDSGYFAETWSGSLTESLSINKLLGNELENVATSTDFPNSSLSRQLQTISRLIATRRARGVDIDTFYVEAGGFDHHANLEEALSSRFISIDGAIKAFVDEMKFMGLWDNVAVIETSDFARTLNPNSGDGTDHAWGGNYFLMGGSVKGGKILGKYPDDLTTEGPQTLGRGRMIPTTPWDAVFSGIASWAGVPNSDLTKVCPNLNNFESFMFTANNMFGNVPPPAPTSPPSPAPKTNAPTFEPTKAPVKAPDGTNSPTNTDSPTKAGDDGSAFPTISPVCSDDEYYEFEGMEGRTCKDWVKEKRKNRCRKLDGSTKKYVFEHCQKECRRCICQNDDWFFKGVKKKNCEWVGEKPDRRCKIPGAKEHCKEKCKGFGAVKCCEDNPKYIRSDSTADKPRGCEWAKRKPNIRCTKGFDKDKKFVYACPAACNRCPA